MVTRSRESRSAIQPTRPTAPFRARCAGHGSNEQPLPPTALSPPRGPPERENADGRCICHHPRRCQRLVALPHRDPERAVDHPHRPHRPLPPRSPLAAPEGGSTQCVDQPLEIAADHISKPEEYDLCADLGTKADLERLGITFQEGLPLRVSDGDMAAQGKVRWAPALQEWVIDIDPDTMKEITK